MKQSAASVILFVILSLASCGREEYDVIVVGGGASGVCAGLQAARMGANTLILEQTPWLGGMLTSAGVSAIDGNYRLRAGIFGEFCDSLAGRYGGYDSLKTGWVSNILFEPHIGAEIFDNMTFLQNNLTVRKNVPLMEIVGNGASSEMFVGNGASSRLAAKNGAPAGRVSQKSTPSAESPQKNTPTAKASHKNTPAGRVSRKNTPSGKVFRRGEGWAIRSGYTTYYCKVLIDCTELGDVARECGVKYEAGNENGIEQDMTYVIIAQDFGPGVDKTIPCPEGYDRNNYVNCCINPLNTPVFEKGQTLWSPEKMLSYGRLPGGRIMLNWPIEGNDYYSNVIDASPAEREEIFRKAKNKALGYLYFIQAELGYRSIGIADGEFPTEDGLPFFPYFRESRRIDGEARLTFDAVAATYDYPEPLYRAGIAVGDYPVDHHHYANPDWRELHKSYTAIPSFTVPAGALIPKDVDNLIVAEKSISADNSIAGATRLQPVVMELGQAAGVIAAIAVKENVKVRDVRVRKVQQALLDAGARIQPYLDLDPSDPDFKLLQRVGSTGLFKAEGRNAGWSDEMWMLQGKPERLDSMKTADRLHHPFGKEIDWRGNYLE